MQEKFIPKAWVFDLKESLQAISQVLVGIEFFGTCRNTECPDSKGIKTPKSMIAMQRAEILNALIQKGLRPFAERDRIAGMKY